MTDQTETPPPETLAEKPAVAARVPMVFAARSWAYRMSYNRNGRGEGERTEIAGTIAATSGGDAIAARVVIVPKDATQRLELALAKPEATLNVPLEEYSLARIQDAMKEYFGRFGMEIRITFEAVPTLGRQLLDTIHFSFEKPHVGPQDGPPQQSGGHSGGQ